MKAQPQGDFGLYIWKSDYSILTKLEAIKNSYLISGGMNCINPEILEFSTKPSERP